MSKINVELVRGIALVISLLGLIGLGAAKPDSLGSAAIGGLSGVIGGYFGLASPRKGEDRDQDQEKDK